MVLMLRNITCPKPCLRFSQARCVLSSCKPSSRVSFFHTLPGPPPKKGYPQRLLVYHAGTGRTVFIGCMKITTVLLFSVSCLVLAPAFYYTPGEPNWAAFAAIVGGAIPMLFVTYVTSPFVNYIHIKLPHVTIRTRDQLMRWAYKMPRNTEIDLTTMRFSGLPRVSRMTLADLRQSKGRFGVANLAKSSSSKKPLRPWWKGTVPKLFYVDNERVKVRKAVEAPSSVGKKAIWELVLDRIEKS